MFDMFTQGILIIGVCIIGIIVLILGAVVYIYNRMITLRERCDNAWAQIDVQLKRRFDLIPNLVETVKGYVKHEKSTFENVTRARTLFMNSSSPKQMAKADNMLAGALKTLFAVAENYPKLMANENFKQLQQELSETENKVAYSRQFYNDISTEYNIVIQKIPYVLMAPVMGFKERELFKVKEEDKKPVKVKF